MRAVADSLARVKRRTQLLRRLAKVKRFDRRGLGIPDHLVHLGFVAARVRLRPGAGPAMLLIGASILMLANAFEDLRSWLCFAILFVLLVRTKLLATGGVWQDADGKNRHGFVLRGGRFPRLLSRPRPAVPKAVVELSEAIQDPYFGEIGFALNTDAPIAMSGDRVVFLVTGDRWRHRKSDWIMNPFLRYARRRIYADPLLSADSVEYLVERFVLTLSPYRSHVARYRKEESRARAAQLRAGLAVM